MDDHSDGVQTQDRKTSCELKDNSPFDKCNTKQLQISSKNELDLLKSIVKKKVKKEILLF